MRADAYLAHHIWEHSATVRELYARRCRREAEEMTCAAQCAELLARRVRPGDTVLDAGCGSGYLWHSLRDRGLDVEYWGVDASPTLIGIGRREMPALGLPAARLIEARIEDLDGAVDHVVCMNVLSNLDSYHRPLSRLLGMARRSLVLRESMHAAPARYAWVRDRYLDPGVELWVHVNTYDRDEVAAFVRAHGFRARLVTDRRTGGRPEDVIGHPHHWTFLVADREDPTP
ncbi:MAG TPA: class I SAM-dependent methyltransferase [Miltoncostaeaceae bacterium]|nr:class I SAM-dependent methyltransferase [Miltoncostaeaceae bacterium]